MSEFQQIEKLMRLKRFEAPAEDFVEEFLVKFRERQRSEMLRQSARGLLLERFETYFHGLIMPKWSMAAATATVALMAGWGTLHLIGNQSHPAVSDLSFQSPELVSGRLLAVAGQAPNLDVDTELFKKVTAPDQVEIESFVLLSRHFESNALRMEVFDLPGVSKDLISSEFALMPVSSLPR